MNTTKKADAPLHGTSAVTAKPSREHSNYNTASVTGQEASPRPSYWAVLPAKVRYDAQLRPNAKLLYAEITALSNAQGYCWISNERLGDWFGLSPKTVGALIQQLGRCGYLTVELIRDEKQAITGRRIWIDRPAAADLDTPILKNEETPLKIEDTPILKNEEKNNTSNMNNTPHNPPKGGRRAKSVPDYEPELFERFWRAYPCHKARQDAIREWDRLRPDRKLMRTMSAALDRAKNSPEWQRGIGIPYACRWLSKRRWTDEEDLRLAENNPPIKAAEEGPEWI